MQPQSLKITIKLKSEKATDNPLTTVDHPSNNVERQDQVDLSSTKSEKGADNPLTTVDHPSNNVEGQDQVDSSTTTQAFENKHSTEYEQNYNCNSNYQLVLYDPNIANQAVETEHVQVDPIGHRPRPHPFLNQAPRVLPSIGAFTVQCARCFKWRLIPTKEKYEEIREHITEQPFVCETGREWRPEISCDDPPDMTQDGSTLWAIDKPNIAQAPPGWERLLRIRGEGGSKFADVYYVAPSGKRLRSMVEIQKYLNEHPEYVEEGVSLSRFSFQTPRPLRENYVRKRPAHASLVQPIAWVSPDVDTALQLSDPGLSNDYSMSPSSNPEVKSAKKKRGLSKRSCDDGLIYNQKDVNMSKSSQL